MTEWIWHWNFLESLSFANVCPRYSHSLYLPLSLSPSLTLYLSISVRAVVAGSSRSWSRQWQPLSVRLSDWMDESQPAPHHTVNSSGSLDRLGASFTSQMMFLHLWLPSVSKHQSALNTPELDICRASWAIFWLWALRGNNGEMSKQIKWTTKTLFCFINVFWCGLCFYLVKRDLQTDGEWSKWQFAKIWLYLNLTSVFFCTLTTYISHMNHMWRASEAETL